MNRIRQMILTDWHFVRILRLVLGLAIGVNAVMTHEAISVFFSAIFLFQAVTNTGCCGTSCAAPVRKERQPEEKEIVFEEIKEK